MILSPNLDDRTYQDIVDEAIKLIPHYCPDWTNHNPTDPGVTLIELFAWMTEMVIYRLNKVPEKNYLTLLDLIGLSLNPPQPSRALLTFSPVERYEGEILVKKGTQVSTTRSDSSNAIVFETENDLIVTNISLEACYSTEHGLVTNNLKNDIDSEKEGFVLFSGTDEIKRYIYISDPSFAFLQDNNIINVFFNNANEIKTVNDEIVNFLEWEYWNGKKWVAVEYHRSVPGNRKKDNELFFSGPIEIDETEVEGVTGFFLRASLVTIPERHLCFELNDVRVKLLFNGEGLIPDDCICNTDNMVFTPVDITKEFTPYIGVPKYNDAFYISSNEAFSKADSDIIIDFRLSDAEGVNRPDENKDLILKYEYWNGRNWVKIASTTQQRERKPVGEYNFNDSTNAFSLSGSVSFKRPDDMQAVEISGQENFWLRIRIGAGDFGTGGEYRMDEEGKWVWHYDRPVNPPVLTNISIRYEATQKPLKEILSYYDFNYHKFSEASNENFWNKLEDEEAEIPFFSIFEINKEICPITYFGFNKKFPQNNAGIYFRINEKRKIEPQRNTIIPDSIKVNLVKSKRPISLKWEYWNGKDWKILSVNDYTDNFHESGFIEFTCPHDLADKTEFGKSLHWIRLILESGTFEVNPRIISIDLNSVYALNHQTRTNETLGTSNGTPSQVFEILHSPVLPGVKLVVKEKHLPPADERDLILKEEGEDAISIVKNADGKDEIWIRYHMVDNFYNSTPKSRHYYLDFMKNTISFGDGKKGLIPPREKNNIRISKYQTGGGSAGNVGHQTINLLRENIPFIAEVKNLYAAEGGCDIEGIDSLKSRATNVFKNLNRAVTAEDYEWLAMEASASVARAKCLSKVGKKGEVNIIIVPKPDSSDFNLKKELYPSTELIRRVREFLNYRKLVGTKLRVEPPSYIHICLNLKIVFKKEVSEIQIMRERVELAIRRYMHPIVGGPKGEGWPFAMPLTKNEIFMVLDKIDEIYFVEEIEILNEDTGVVVEKLLMNEDNLISISKVNIVERKNQF